MHKHWTINYVTVDSFTYLFILSTNISWVPTLCQHEALEYSSEQGEKRWTVFTEEMRPQAEQNWWGIFLGKVGQEVHCFGHDYDNEMSIWYSREDVRLVALVFGKNSGVEIQIWKLDVFDIQFTILG
jgi:hypothetical protein